jgi:hypothetical protein
VIVMVLGPVAALAIALSLWRARTAVTAIDRSTVQTHEPVSFKPAPPGDQSVTQGPEVSPIASARPVMQLNFKHRAPEDWQGMLVNLAAQPECEATERCGLARVCKGGVCTACDADSECARGEVCVLDHCVLADRVSCRRKADCGRDAQCILNGYSFDPRGNGSMEARCVEHRSGTRRPPMLEAPVDSSGRELPFDDELHRAQELMRRPQSN